MEDLLLVVLAVCTVLFGGLFSVMREKDKRTQAECAFLKEQLKQACKMEAAARMAGGAAHDFNNMLAGISGAAECLKGKLKKDAELVRFCDVILSGSEQASHLARQMTQLSAHRAEKPQAINLKDCLKESLSLLGHGIGKEMKIVENFCKEKLFAAIKHEDLQSLILNLGFNSRDAATGRGKITSGLRRVCLTDDDMRQNLIPVPAGEYAEISFADDGSGISAENMTHIFEPFFTTKNDGKGTGLGLPEVYGIVLSAGGTLRVENLKKGVCFHIFLPLAEAVSVSEKKKRCSRLRAKILVADDDPLLCELAAEILKKAGCSVRTAKSAEEAEEICRKDFKPDAVMLDVVLPQGGGKAVYQKLRKKNRHLKIVFMSGSAPDDEIAEILKKDECAAFLDKPSRAAQMVETLRFLLAKA